MCFSPAAAAVKSLQSCPTLCNPINSSSPGSTVPGILQASILVHCHFLLQYMKVKSESEVAQSCPTLCDPMDRSTQASLSITNSQSLLKIMSIESVMPSNHLTLCRPLLLPPSISPSIRVFSNESVLCIRAKVLEFQLKHQSFQ